jgi:hypothetical protein
MVVVFMAYTSKNYIVYNYNHCDAFYYGYDNDEDALDCTKGTTCDRCGRSGKDFKPFESHDLLESFSASSVFVNGNYECDCKNENCTAVDTKKETKPVFTAKGYSTNLDKNAINGGYTVDLESLALYERFIGKLTYGIVIANAKTFDGKEFFDENNMVNSTKALQVEMDGEYSNFDCSILFGANSNVDLNLVITAYIVEGNSVSFLQYESGDEAKIGSNTFKSVTLAQVIALIPAVSKEN